MTLNGRAGFAASDAAGASPASGAPKLAQRIAELIERDILVNERPVGESLGTEAELMARYGAGRSVLREALVLVARDGLAEMRRGKVGGLVVTAPSEALIAAGLRSYVDLVLTGWEELWRIRRELEDLALQLAVERFGVADIEPFEALQRRFLAAPDNRVRRMLGREILGRIAATSRNPFLSVLVTALSSLSTERFARSHAPSLLAHADETTFLRYEQLRAVLAASPSRAMAAGARIFEIFERMSTIPAEPNSLGPEGRASLAELMETPPDRQKLAEKVTLQLKERIIAGKLSEGAHLGSEPELMAAWGVSRGVIREAVRILERHSVAKMVRGKGGGLRVLTPIPADVVRSTSVYLRLAGVDRRHLQELGDVMGRLAAEMAARNVERLDPDRLKAQVDGLAGLRGESLRALAFAYYNVMGDLSGSRAIGLILSIQANLYALDESASADPVVVKEVVPERLRSLLDAILAGDADLARRRMMLLQRSGAGIRLRPLAALAEPELLAVLDGAGDGL